MYSCDWWLCILQTSTKWKVLISLYTAHCVRFHKIASPLSPRHSAGPSSSSWRSSPNIIAKALASKRNTRSLVLWVLAHSQQSLHRSAYFADHVHCAGLLSRVNWVIDVYTHKTQNVCNTLYIVHMYWCSDDVALSSFYVAFRRRCRCRGVESMRFFSRAKPNKLCDPESVVLCFVVHSRKKPTRHVYGIIVAYVFVCICVLYIPRIAREYRVCVRKRIVRGERLYKRTINIVWDTAAAAARDVGFIHSFILQTREVSANNSRAFQLWENRTSYRSAAQIHTSACNIMGKT